MSEQSPGVLYKHFAFYFVGFFQSFPEHERAVAGSFVRASAAGPGRGTSGAVPDEKNLGEQVH